MTTTQIKKLLDTCYVAGRVRGLLPPLPQGVLPSYIQYLDVIHTLSQRGEPVRVSDVSDALDLPRPGVTRTVKEMEAKGYLAKTASAEDRRVTYLSLTEAGQQLYAQYDTEYFRALLPALAGVSDADAACTIRTIETLYRVLSGRKTTHEN